MVERIFEEQQAKQMSEIKNASCLADCYELDARMERAVISETEVSSICSKGKVVHYSSGEKFEKDQPTKSLSQVKATESFVNGSSEIEPFFVFDPNSIVGQHTIWKNKLPRITPFYAVKCNNDPMVLKTLYSLETSFDCASMEEIRSILAYGVSPNRIIYANPCKAPSHLKYAAEKGVLKLTFDNADELFKVKELHPNAQLVIRILVDDSKSICQFGVKFGVRLGSTKPLLELAKRLGLEVIGVSFHVGSGCTDSSAYSDAIKRAKDVFEEAKEIGFNFSLLDIGGGFPGLSGAQNGVKIEFEEIADVINVALDDHFADRKDIELIAEPGRYFTSSAFSLVANITSRRTIENETEGNSYMYYINDGVYGSFNCLIFDHAILPVPRFLIKNCLDKKVAHSFIEQFDSPLFNCSIWGPTCDSMDCLTKSIKLPELNVGDWMIFDNMGAYTLVAATNFNGMNKPNCYALSSDEYSNPCLKPALDTEFSVNKSF